MAAMQKQTLTQTLLSLLKTQIHFADFRIKKLFVFSGIYNFETNDKIIILNILQIMIRLNNLSLVLKLLHNNKVRYLITIDNVFLLQNIKHYFYSLFQKNKYKIGRAHV